MRLATIPDDKIASSVPSGAATAMPVGTSVLPLAGTMMSTALARSEPASVLGEKNVVVGYSCFSSSSSSFSSFLPAPAASLPWAPSVSLSFSGYSSVCCLRVAEEGAVTRWRAKKGGHSCEVFKWGGTLEGLPRHLSLSSSMSLCAGDSSGALLLIWAKCG
jgi:hypothetical protein